MADVSENQLWSRLRVNRLQLGKTRGARCISCLLLIALLALQPSCTLCGLGAGIIISSEPGPYTERPLPPGARHDARTFEQLKLTKDERIQLILLDGTRLEGKYLALEPPTAGDAVMYIVLVPERENGHHPAQRKTPRRIPLSEVTTLSVEDKNYAWIPAGAVLGFLFDLFAYELGKGFLKSLYQDD